MGEAIGIRLEDSFLKKIEKISKEEVLDRSSTIRKLLQIGYLNFIKKKAAEDYLRSKITMSEAAGNAEMTVWEMEEYLVEQGYKSQYSVEDLNQEINFLNFPYFLYTTPNSFKISFCFGSRGTWTLHS